MPTTSGRLVAESRLQGPAITLDALRIIDPSGRYRRCPPDLARRLVFRDLADSLPDEMIEAVAREIHPGKWWDEPHLWKASIALYRNEAKTVLRAGLSAVGEKP